LAIDSRLSEMRCRVVMSAVKWFCILGLVLGLNSVCAQSTGGIQAAYGSEEEQQLPPAPLSYVLDEAGVFANDADKFHEIVGRLSQMHEVHGFPIFLVTANNFSASSVDQLARRYYDAWIGESRQGLLVYYDSDTGESEIAQQKQDVHEKGYDDYLNVDKEESSSQFAIPDYLVQDCRDKLDQAFEELAENDEVPEDQAEYLELWVKKLTAFLDESISETNARSSSTGGMNVLWWILPVVLLGALGFWFWQRRQQQSINLAEECWFPKVFVGARLGAKHGGGKSGEISFGE